jgi:murein DD-endopeptidase MepM/ murein hydrolase activator NlpD
MKWSIRQPVWAGGIAGAMLAIGSSSAPSSSAGRGASVDDFVPAIERVAESPGAGVRWLARTRAALDDALEVRVPFTEIKELSQEASAAFAFDALGGQTLEIRLTRDLAESADTRIYVEVFRVVDVLGQALHERLTALRPSEMSLRTRLPSDGSYHVLVQTEGSGAGSYRLTLELAAAIPFPVVGAREEAIRSLFGASRDAGRRHHEGIDIFVQRLTPVLAVAAGRVMPRQDALGGNTVWLNTPGTSYYYAHLDRIAVREQQAVKVGDVLGYVGNTGNALNVPSHLHFGVYRWGREPIDPLPLLVGQRFAEGSAATLAADAGG